MNHPLLEKLETYYIRFKEIGQLITDPEVIQDMERYVTEEVKGQLHCGEVPDFREGICAFVEKRKPQYQ